MARLQRNVWQLTDGQNGQQAKASHKGVPPPSHEAMDSSDPVVYTKPQLTRQQQQQQQKLTTSTTNNSTTK